MAKKYIVTLNDSERDCLKVLTKGRSLNTVCIKRAFVLLAADENGELAWKDEQICEAYHMGLRTVERLRKRFTEDGLDAIYNRKREPSEPKFITGDVEAKIIALRCSSPPEGRSAWTMQLLADEMIRLDYVETISDESIRQVLKKTKSSLGR